MAFATSSSAFGIKPSGSTGAFGSQPAAQPSTSNPSPFGSFGGTSSSQQPAQPSIFGGLGQNQNQNQNQPAPGGLFGQQTPAQQPPQQPAGGLFGQPTAQQQPQQTGGLFGQQQPQQQSQQPSIGLFGQQQPQQPAGGLFGQQQPQQQSQQPASGLFGQQQPQQQPQQPSGGLFGGSTWGSSTTANTSTQPVQGASGGWGLSNQLQNQQPQQQSTGFGTGSSIFGNTGGQTQAHPQGGGLFGSGAAPSTGQSLFSQSTLNAPPASQQQQPPTFTRTTKFNDLPEQMQKMFESVDTHIQGRIQISNDLKARSLDEEPTKGAELIRKVHNDLVNTMGTLQVDKAFAEELKSKVDQSVQDTIITTRIIDGYRSPQQNGTYLKDHANFPLEFFTRAAEEIRHKLQWYKATIEQIERRLASAQNQVQYNPQAITATLQAQNSTFIALAGKTAELDAELQKVKSAYRELWRAHTGSARDPFNEVDRRPGDGGGLLNGVGSINLGR